jgi:glycosyltransferase involved in cell wall biosynthesis
VIGAIARFFRLPHVVHLHGIDFREFWAGAGPMLANAISKLFEGSNRIVVMGRFWSDVITERLPHVADRVVIIPNATPIPDVARTAPHDHRVRITFLGKVGARKGTPHLINALVALRERDDWKAVIAGDGDVAEAKAALRRHGLTDRVEVPGWLDLNGRNELLGKTDILVLPSLAENLPMAVMEALAMGLAVITTPVGAIPEVIESERNGVLVPPGDEPALASALARLIGDGALRARLGAAARKDIEERFDFEVYVRRLTTVWQAAADL